MGLFFRSQETYFVGIRTFLCRYGRGRGALNHSIGWARRVQDSPDQASTIPNTARLNGCAEDGLAMLQVARVAARVNSVSSFDDVKMLDSTYNL